MKKNVTLLYVEDDAVIRENFTQIFESYFSTVLSTDNGDEALKLYKENAVDIAIFDVQLNGMDGITLASTIRESDKELIILLISAYSDTPKLLQAIKLKLFGYLVKPVPLETLIKTIDDIAQSVSEKNIYHLSAEYSWDRRCDILYLHNKAVKLTKKETLVIGLLLENRNSYMSACEIQESLFTEELKVSNCNNTVQLLSRLKKKLEGVNPDTYFIENGYAQGYRIRFK